MGAPLAGRVLIVDDVISAGTSVRESVEYIHAAGATPAGVAIALDRMERGNGELSAVQGEHQDGPELERGHHAQGRRRIVGKLQYQPVLRGYLHPTEDQ